MKKTPLFASLVYLLLSTCAFSATYTVHPDGSGDYPTIQVAIDIAVGGDIIQVEDGTYTGDGNRDIDFLGKAITVRGNIADPNLVVIDCQGTEAEPHRGFKFVSGENSDSVLEGITITNGYVDNDNLYGGGIYCFNSRPTIQFCIIKNNYARFGAGLSGCDGMIQHCTIVGNSAAAGGGLINCSGIIRNCIIADNTAGQNGAGFFNCDGTIQNCTVSGNIAGVSGEGGGLYGCNGLIENCIVINNSAKYGGGLYCYGDATIQGCTISNNSATYDGGGIDDCSGTIQDCSITYNSAGFRGGGLNDCDGMIRDCDISNNSGDLTPLQATTGGGGLYGCDGTILNCIVNDNISGSGGGICNGNATLESSTISNNNSTGRGGGLHGFGGMIQDCVISDNVAISQGGGLSHFSGVMQNCIVSDNSAKSGGGVYWGDQSTIQNSIIVYNSADEMGGGMYVFHGSILSSIIWGNTAVAGPQVYNSDEFAYCCIQDWSEGGIGNISDDPLFVNDTSNDFHLLPNSPCINAGDPAVAYDPSEADYYGDQRAVGGRVDIGISEYYDTENNLRLSGDPLVYTAFINGPTSWKWLDISNLGINGQFDWAISGAPSWLTINKTQGSLDHTMLEEVPIRPVATGLSEGLYTCELTVSASNTSNSPQMVQVEFEIMPINISGVIDKDGEPFAGVSVNADNGGTSDVTGPNGYYEIAVPYNWSGTIAPDVSQWPEYSITPINISYTNVTSDRINQDYSLWKPVITISFQDYDSNPVNGAEVDVTGFSEPIIFDGTYDLIVPYGWSGAITPSKLKFDSDPDEISFINITEQDINAEFTTTNYLYSGGNGTKSNPFLISEASDLRNLANDQQNWDKYFIMVNDINMGDPNTPNMDSIGSSITPFSGTFDGQGFSINKLNIYNRRGLFDTVDIVNPETLMLPQIKNLTLINPTTVGENNYYGSFLALYVGAEITIENCIVQGGIAISKYSGTLVRENHGVIRNCHTVDIHVESSEWGAGGLVRENFGLITGCTASGTVKGGLYTGGLVGWSEGDNALIKNSSASCTVNGGEGTGGLIGVNQARVEICSASGNVQGFHRTGGLIGINRSELSNCDSIGNVNGGNMIGGLVGDNTSNVSDCFSTGDVSGYDNVGGLMGYASGDITNCYATGNVSSSHSYIGGLIGLASDTVSGCFALGDVNGDYGVGGLIGLNLVADISNCYSRGTVTGSDAVGGFTGYDRGDTEYCYSVGTVVAPDSSQGGGFSGTRHSSSPPNYLSCFWNIDNNPGLLNFGDITDPNITNPNVTGMLTTDMQSKISYTEWDFLSDPNDGTEDIWSICEETNYPRLTWQIPAGDYLCPDGVALEDHAFFAEHWLQTDYGTAEGAELTGDGFVGIDDLLALTDYWLLFGCSDCDGRDMTGEGNIDLSDLSYMAQRWQQSDYGDCGGAELTGDGVVDIDDYMLFLENWLVGIE